jgi:hypothetical protein
MMASRLVALCWTRRAWLRCSALRGESSINPVNPRMPFIGVRISWLMVARNSLFARLAALASLVATINAAFWSSS